MKMFVKVLLVSVLCSSTACATVTYSQKTFLMPRAVGVNKGMEQTTWLSHLYSHAGKKQKPTINSHVQMTPFFQQSLNRSEVGHYFGIGNGKNSFTVGRGNNAAVGVANLQDGTVDIENSALIHDQANAHVSTLAGTVSFNPRQEIYGLRLDYFQYVNSPIKNLFFKASMPIVHVENDMGMTIKDATNVTVGGKEFSLADFFAGRVTVPQNAANNETNLQLPLTKAKINGRRSAAGLADLDLALGYQCVHDAKKHACLNIGITIPTGSRVKGEYLFEPVYGNGHHVGLGAGIDAGFQIWKGTRGEVRIDVGANYKYLFEATEQRTVSARGFKVQVNAAGPVLRDLLLSHYALVNKNVATIDQAFFPAANVLTQALRIKPGSQFDSIIDLSFQNRQFVVDLGYNLYWKDGESAWIKGWNDTAFGFAPLNADSHAAANAMGALQLIPQRSLNVAAVKTPTQVTHKVFGGLGYKYKVYDDYPSSIACGASYEMAQDNAVLEQYALWVKAGFSF